MSDQANPKRELKQGKFGLFVGSRHMIPFENALLFAEDDEGYVRPVCVDRVGDLCNALIVHSLNYLDITNPVSHIYEQDLPGGGSVTIDLNLLDYTGFRYYRTIAVVVVLTYGINATDGVRVRMLWGFGIDNYDSPEEADNMGRYYDLTFAPGAKRRATIIFPVLSYMGQLMITNKDPVNAHRLHQVATYFIT